MRHIETQFLSLFQNSDEKLGQKMLSFVCKYGDILIKSRNLIKMDLADLWNDTLFLSRRYLLTDQLSIAKLFLLTIILGSNFLNEKRYIYVEASLNNNELGNEKKVEAICELLFSGTLLDMEKDEHKFLYQLIRLKPLQEKKDLLALMKEGIKKLK